MENTSGMISTRDIATMFGIGREYVTDVLVKRPGFPAPALVASRSMRRWNREEVETWRQKSRQQRGS
jgi:predicted DNA-binding transcriptional regulator AlpA